MENEHGLMDCMDSDRVSKVHLPGASEGSKSESESGLEEVTAGNALSLVKDTNLHILQD